MPIPIIILNTTVLSDYFEVVVIEVENHFAENERGCRDITS